MALVAIIVTESGGIGVSSLDAMLAANDWL